MLQVTRYIFKLFYFKLINKNAEFDRAFVALCDLLFKGKNFVLYRSHLNWLNDEEFLRVNNDWPHYGCPNDRRYFLWKVAKKAGLLNADTVECGVAAGTSSYIILNGVNRDTINHHIFDSFEGLSQPSVNDGFHWKKGDISFELEKVQKNLGNYKNCKYYKGWIPHRFNELSDKNFSLVHIDLDLYEPIMDSLNFFYERVISGGFIISDDYGLNTCPGAKKAFDEFFYDKPDLMIEIPTGQLLVLKK